MATRSQPTFTIGQFMALVAALAVTWALFTTPGSARFVFWVLMPLTLLIVGPIVVIRHILENSVGIACPYCGAAGSMERRAISSFGARFYRCNTCGVRCRCGAFGAWEDASAGVRREVPEEGRGRPLVRPAGARGRGPDLLQDPRQPRPEQAAPEARQPERPRAGATVPVRVSRSSRPAVARAASGR